MEVFSPQLFVLLCSSYTDVLVSWRLQPINATSLVMEVRTFLRKRFIYVVCVTAVFTGLYTVSKNGNYSNLSYMAQKQFDKFLAHNSPSHVTRSGEMSPEPSQTISSTSAPRSYGSTVRSDKNTKLIERVYEERREMVRKGCLSMNRTIENTGIVRGLVEPRHNIFYCPIPKVSSTFWKRLLTILKNPNDKRSVFDLTLSDVRLLPLKSFPEQEQKRFLNSATSFLFIRDPYARLFSGYENKIYHPNIFYWTSIGRKAVSYARNLTDNKYGFDVSFPEFVSYILYINDNNLPIDLHFKPMYKICDPCKHTFQIIGKLESFTEDVEYILDKWNREFEDFNIHFDDFTKETAISMARGRVKCLYQLKSILNKIQFPFKKLMLRTWRDLQIRGFMTKDAKFPFSDDTDITNLTKEQFLDAVQEGLEATVNSTAAKEQREEALIQAYRQIPMEDMERLSRYVWEDCQLFGFDNRPRKLFDRSKPVKTDGFLYLDGLQ